MYCYCMKLFQQSSEIVKYSFEVQMNEWGEGGGERTNSNEKLEENHSQRKLHMSHMSRSILQVYGRRNRGKGKWKENSQLLNSSE